MPTPNACHEAQRPGPRVARARDRVVGGGCGARGRHVTRYFGGLSSHSALRSRIIPGFTSPLPADTQDEETPADDSPPVKHKSKYIPWNELLRRTFNVELKCVNCKGDLRLIALIKTAATIKKILAARGLPTLPPAATPARAPQCMNFDDWEN